MNEKNKRKNIFYLSTVAGLAVIVGLSYSVSVIVGSIVEGKWEYLDKGIQEGMVATTNNINADRSFNESSLDGANIYAKYNKKYFANYSKIGYLTPDAMNDINEYQNLQQMAFDNGTEFIAATGFNIIDSILGTTVYTATGMYRESNGTIFNDKYKDKMFLSIDDSAHASSIARNVVSIRFETQYAGFAAGVAASIYATSIGADRVSAYGGLAFNSVFDWMSGYEQGINWFNYAVLGYDLSNEKVNSDAFLYDSSYSDEPIHLINGYKLSDEQYTEDSLYIDYNNSTSQDNANLWYTGSFNIGDATTISAKQLDAGSKVVFPVAGGQLIDTLNQIAIYNEGSSTDAVAIGVDANAASQYSDYDEYILGSGIKNIRAAMVIGLWYVDRFIETYNYNLPTDHYVFEDALEFLVSNTPEDPSQTFTFNNGKTYELYGWKEYNTQFTSRDYATMTDDEVREDYQETPDPTIAYSPDIAYEDYGEQYPGDYGSEFVGNYENQGVGFISSDILESSFDLLLDEYNSISSLNLDLDFQDFLIYAFSENPVIENASNTFSAAGAIPLTLGMHAEYPWIPDWTTYSK